MGTGSRRKGKVPFRLRTKTTASGAVPSRRFPRDGGAADSVGWWGWARTTKTETYCGGGDGDGEGGGDGATLEHPLVLQQAARAEAVGAPDGPTTPTTKR